MHGRQSNDTILENLYLELEACCTYPPSRAASTFYAVDGECLVLPAKSKMREKPCHPAQSFGLFFFFFFGLTLTLIFPILGVPKPSAPSTWLLQSTGLLAVYESQLRAYGSNTVDLLRAMWELHSSRKHYTLLQDMALEQAKLHVGIPYPKHWTRVFYTIIAGSILLHLGKGMYAQRSRTPSVRNCRAPGICRNGSMPLIELFYLVCYLAETVQRGGKVWDSHFAVGVAWITVVDFVDHVGCMEVKF